MRETSRFVLALACAGAAVLAGGVAGARAQTYVEAGDAPELDGGLETGSGALTSIEGFLGVNEADMFMIRVDDWSLFSANTADDAGLLTPFFDTSMFLFDSSGHGIAFRDDTSAGVRAAFDAGDPLFAGRSNGEIVWLAISGWDYDPMSAGTEMWLDEPFDVMRGPDGPGATGAVDGWAGDFTDSGQYRVMLTGVSAVPAPGAVALFAIGALFGVRRR